jgi:hypothetical protein
MRRIAWLCLTIVVAACAGGQDDASTAADTTAAAPAAATAPALTLADLTGTWQVEVRPETGDSVLLRYTLNAPEDTSKWTMQFEGQTQAVPVHIVAISGDSLVTHAGPYPSAMRRGVQVTTNAVSRLENGMMVGTAVGHYTASGPDSVRTFRTMGMRH